MTRCALSFFALPRLRFAAPLDFDGGPSSISRDVYREILKNTERAGDVVELKVMTSLLGGATVRVGNVEMAEESCGFSIAVPSVEHPNDRATFFLFNAAKVGTEIELRRTFLWLGASTVRNSLPKRLKLYSQLCKHAKLSVAMPVEWQDYTDRLFRLPKKAGNAAYKSRQKNAGRGRDLTAKAQVKQVR